LSAARGIALSALVLAVLLAGYLLLFRGGGGHEYTLVFQTAGQLVKDDDLFEMRKQFGVLFQDGALFGSMNLWDHVALPPRQHTAQGED
jgi:ABC-type transporter Mla maintaining outer membrane lipid asymmetry ATPase subunit MlaF